MMTWTPVSSFALFDNAMVGGYEMRQWEQAMTPTWLVEVCDETGTLRVTIDNRKHIIPSTRLRSIDCAEFTVPAKAPAWLSSLPLTGEPAPTAAPPSTEPGPSNVVSLKKPSKKDKPKN